MKNDTIISKKTNFVWTEDHKKIAYDHYAKGHHTVVILAHGFFNSKKALLFKDMAEALLDDYDVIVMDFRGHGQSQGYFNWTANEYKDLTAILKFAHEHYTKVGVIGFSLGAATSIITAARTELIDSLIAVSAPTEFGKIDMHIWKPEVAENVVYNLFQNGRIGKGVKPGNLWLKKIKPIEVIDKIKCPVFFIHGSRDWLVRPWHSEQLYTKARGRKKLEIMKDRTHAELIYRQDKASMLHLLKDWFVQTLNNK